MRASDSRLQKLPPEGDPTTVEYEYDAETPVSIAIVQAICVLTDTDPLQAPTELGFILHDHVDPDALDTILADGTGTGETVVSFEISDGNTYSVDVADDGRIEIRTPSDASGVS